MKNNLLLSRNSYKCRHKRDGRRHKWRRPVITN